MNKTTIFFAQFKDNNLRLDKFLTNKLISFTRSQIKKIIDSKAIKIDNQIIISASRKVKDGEKICIIHQYQKNENIKPKKINLEIIFEDKDLLIINKRKGMVVHPGAGNHENTLVNALIYKYKKNLSDINGALIPGIVHRIDK